MLGRILMFFVAKIVRADRIGRDILRSGDLLFLAQNNHEQTYKFKGLRIRFGFIVQPVCLQMLSASAREHGIATQPTASSKATLSVPVCVS